VVSLADVSLLAYTRVAHEGGFDLARYAAIRRWIGEPRPVSACRRRAEPLALGPGVSRMNDKSVSIRPARREDVPAMIAMLADDHLGRARERGRIRCLRPITKAFARVERDPNLTLVVAESEGRVAAACNSRSCLVSARKAAWRGLLEDVRVASDCRSRGIGEPIGAMGGR